MAAAAVKRAPSRARSVSVPERCLWAPRGVRGDHGLASYTSTARADLCVVCPGDADRLGERPPRWHDGVLRRGLGRQGERDAERKHDVSH